jgi:hypothetical protein
LQLEESSAKREIQEVGYDDAQRWRILVSRGEFVTTPVVISIVRKFGEVP